MHPSDFRTSVVAQILSHAANASAPTEVQRGTVLIREGQRDAPVALVLDGAFKLVSEAGDGHSAIVGLRFPGWLLGAAPALAGVPAPAAAVSITLSSVQLVSQRAFVEAIAIHADLAAQVLRLHATELCRYTSDVASFSCLSASERLIRLLRSLAQAEPRRGATSELVRVRVPLTHEEMADAIGSSREHVTRLLHQLEDDGVVRRQAGWIHVKRLWATGQPEPGIG